MAGLVDRLKQALEISGMTREALIDVLKEKGVQGASYPSLRTYLNGEVEPSLEFLRATAEACGVQGAWLTAGAGSVKEDDRSRFEVVASVIQKHFPEWERLNSSTRLIVTQTLPGLISRHNNHDPMLESDEEFEEYVEGVVRAFTGPLDALGVQSSDLSGRNLNTYVMNLCLALRALELSL